MNRDARNRDESDHPSRFHVAQHLLEVRLQSGRGEFADEVGLRPFEQGEQRPWRALPQVGERPVLQLARRRRLAIAPLEMVAVVILFFVEENVIGEPRRL